jgi:hypothetical protein
VHHQFGDFLWDSTSVRKDTTRSLNGDGKRLHDATLPNTEAGLRRLFDRIGRNGRILLVVDQPASIGALPVAVARACAGQSLAHLARRRASLSARRSPDSPPCDQGSMGL